MEVVVAKALKPSLRGEFVFQQALCEEILSLNANNGVGGEDFSVDDLLDFSNGEFQLGSVGEGDEEVHYEEDDDEEEEKDSLSSSSLSQDRGGEDDSNSNSTDFSGAGDYEFIFGSELTVQDEADLEWVSRFVDDSLPELSLMHPVGSEQSKSCVEPEPTVCSAKTPRFPSKIPVKARTTKSRKPKSRVWSVSPLLSRPSSPSSCSSVYSSPAPPVLVFVGSVPNADFSSGGSGEPPVKKQKKKAEEQTGGAQFQRRCSHCQSQKTPQWRTGPLGAKTLCNACGVRYKSGRLFAEYRPACSPTFSSDVHSNSHRKVLEIRKRKEMATLAGSALAGSAQTQMVPSY